MRTNPSASSERIEAEIGIFASAVSATTNWIRLSRLNSAATSAATVHRNEAYRSALALWTDTALGCPGNARAHFNFGAELDRQPGRMADALDQYEAALQIEPDYAEANYNLAVELARTPGRSREAVAHYEKALQIDPDNAQAHYNLAIELARTPGAEAGAIEHERAAVRLKPGWAEARNSLGIGLSGLAGRESEAAEEFSEALRIKPDFAEAHVNAAVAYAKMGRMDDAIRHLEAALRLNPNLAGIRNVLNNLKTSQAK